MKNNDIISKKYVILKTSVFLGLFCLLNMNVLGQKMTFRLGDIPLREALEILQEKTVYDFVYNSAEINVEQTVNMDVRDLGIEQILSHILTPLGLAFHQEGNIYVLKKRSLPVKRAFTQFFSGIVRDKDGQPLPGVTVQLKGFPFGTTTDNEGRFSISVPDGDTHELTFSFIGMKTLNVSCKKFNEIIMEEEATMLEEATITTGYQTINRTRMTGAVETISAKNITNKGFSSVGEILRGTLAGVSTRSTSGKPGAMPEIRIRGINSLYGDMDPIWIVDGKPFLGNINDIMPEDIESITVLKDAAASAIYGSQAANGVIVIKRKTGRETSPSITISSSFSFESAPKSKLELMNTDEKIAFERSIYEDYPNQATGGRVIQLLKDADAGKITHAYAENEINRLRGINTDWYDVVFRKPFSHTHSISFYGGTEKTHYYASLNAQQRQGVSLTNDYSNWGAMLRLSHVFNERFSFHFDLNTTIRKNKDTYSLVSPLSYATFANPYECPYDENGDYAYDRSYSYQQSSLKDGYKYDFNYLNELYNNTQESNDLNSTISLELNVKLLDDLKYTTIGSIYNNSKETEYIQGPGTYTAKNRSWLVDLYTELPDYLNNGSLEKNNSRNFGYTWSNRLEYMSTFKEDHFISVFLGHEMSEFKSKGTHILFPEYDEEKGLTSVPELDENQNQYINKLITNLQSQSESRSRSVSFFATASYSYKDRYVIAGSVRMDGADVIGTSNRFSPLWNVSLKYNLHNELFCSKCSWMNELALRFSYGYTGSIDKQALPYNVLSYAFSHDFLGYEVPSNIRPKNPSIKWQKKQDRNFGVDVAVLKNRIRATFNYYNNVMRNVLDTKTLPISVGINSIRFNSASMRNYGFEVNLRTINLRYKDFSWSTNLNIAINRNKILESYYKKISDIPLGYGSTEPVEGTSAHSWLGYRFAGIDPLTGHTLALVDNSHRKNPIGFLREDGSYVLDMDDQSNRKDIRLIKEVLGDSYPPISGGFGTTFTWKQLVLNGSFVFMAGHKISAAYYSVAGTGTVSAAAKNVMKQEANRWRKPGDITNMPGYNISGMSSSLQTDWYDRKLENGNYLKCSEISLGYFFPSKICRKLMLQSLRINFNARDVFTITNYQGADPENFGGFGIPNSRKYMISINVGI